MTNKSKLDEQLAILQAAKEGKEIEVCLKNVGKWAKLHHSPGYAFDFRSHEYRVKKEPDVIYSVSYKRGSDRDLWSNHFSKKEAESAALKAQDGGYTVIIRKFVEVLNDYEN